MDLETKPGDTVKLSAKGTTDPDKDKLMYRWWQYEEADSYKGSIEILNAGKQDALFTGPLDAEKEEIVHII